MSDRADEIAREIDDWLLDHAARPARQHKIAAALRSYGDERVEFLLERLQAWRDAATKNAKVGMIESLMRDVRSLKSKSEIQEGKA